MKGDFTRWSFRAKQHYRGVLKQQGRVDLDSDWNEQGEITAHRIETETTDVIGASGAPQDDAGFMIQAASNNNLSISAGRAYVDGILCENEQANLLITAQPDLPGFQLPTAPGMYLAYLEVWERHITFLDDPEILEVALGGPDTCTRAKTIWQVKLLQAGATNSGINCSTDVPAYDTLIAKSTGTLQAQAQPTAITDPCMVPATAGFRSLENQLYRVEIHNAGTGDAAVDSGTATFKWSRDNGSVVASWIAPPSGQTPGANTLFVSSTGKDSVLGFAAGQWIELSDDTHELNFQPGTLVQLTNVQGQVLTVDSGTVIPSGGSLNLADYKLNPKVRRWDSVGATPTTTGGWLNLENGVQVQFAKGNYATGDYWLIPARTLTASIDWPVDSGGNPVAASPKGIQKHYCRLAVVQFDGKTWSLVATCLPTFPPLTGITAGTDKGIHITGVRTATPDAPLLNDSNVPFDRNVIGVSLVIRILCDAPLDPISIKPSTCIISVDLPYPLDLTNPSAPANTDVIVGYQSLVLPATVSVSNAAGSGEIQVTLTRDNLAFIGNTLSALQTQKRPANLMMHLNLKGNVIWGKDDPTLFLDGEAFGATRTDPDGSTHIGLHLPQSGDGKRGGNFDMWFWFVQPITLQSLAFAPSTVNSGQASTGTVTLSGPAPASGASVTLSSNNPNILGTLPTVTVATNQTIGSFTVTKTTLPAGVGGTPVLVTAAYQGSSAQATLTINPQIVLTKLAFLSAAGGPITSIGGGAPVTLTATLSAPAPAGGAVVTLAAVAGTPPAANVPASITVPAGATTGSIPVITIQRANTFQLSVTGTFGASATATLSITAPGIQ